MRARIGEAARAARLTLQIADASSPNDFDSAFESIVAARADALIILPSPMFYTNYRHLVDLVARHRLPTMYVWREAVEVGGLMSYGADIPDAHVVQANTWPRFSKAQNLVICPLSSR
jgi:putative tryptophan/tyrosine transport system substrate-binding protein